MSFYNKYRPHQFADVLGQEQVTQILKNQARTGSYHHAVLERTKHYVSNLSANDLKRELNNPVFPTVGVRLVGVISDNLQHAGQVAYVRGLLKGKGWLGV